jgi:hypothetical protein
MKLSLCLPVAAAVAVAGLTLSGAPAMASVSAHPESASQRLTAWSNGAGGTDLNAVENALAHNNGAKLARTATIAAEHPQPVDTSDYVAMMRAYHVAGVALSHHNEKASKADLVTATDIAWVVVQNTFAAINRLPVS